MLSPPVNFQGVPCGTSSEDPRSVQQRYLQKQSSLFNNRCPGYLNGNVQCNKGQAILVWSWPPWPQQTIAASDVASKSSVIQLIRTCHVTTPLLWVRSGQILAVFLVPLNIILPLCPLRLHCAFSKNKDILLGNNRPINKTRTMM